MDQVSIEYGSFEVDARSSLSNDPSEQVIDGAEAFSDQHLRYGAYNEYLIDSTYSTDTGLRVLPKASSGENATIQNSVVRIHRGTTEKCVQWTCERCNEKPVLPALTTSDPNEIPIRQEIKFANKYQLANGQKLYRVSGVNVYQLVKPKSPNSVYPIGTTPAEISPSAANFFSSLDFSTTIIDAGFAAPGGILQTPIRVGKFI